LSVGDRVTINQLLTRVPGLDEVLGGGLPEYSFNLIAGAPGTGKTTLSQQLMFALGTPERPRRRSARTFENPSTAWRAR
jgi:circadian clock protein KaiC